MALGAALFGAD